MRKVKMVNRKRKIKFCLKCYACYINSQNYAKTNVVNKFQAFDNFFFLLVYCNRKKKTKRNKNVNKEANVCCVGFQRLR